MSHSEHTNGNAPELRLILPGEPPPPAANRTALWHKTLATAAILYTLAIICLWAWMVWEGDREWLATMILFSPRWLFGLPLPLLALAAAIWYRRLLVLLAIAAFVLIGPFMGFKANLATSEAAPATLRVLTCNIAQNWFDKEAFAEVVVTEQPDVVALQEVGWNTKFIWPDEWHVLCATNSSWPAAGRSSSNSNCAGPRTRARSRQYAIGSSCPIATCT